MPEVKGRRRILSQEEVERMILRSDWRMKGLIALLYLTGARINEALEVKAEGITENGDHVYINIPFSKRREKRMGEDHVVPIPRGAPFLEHILFLKQYFKQGKLFDFSRQNAWQKLKRLDPEIYPHLFRHTRATRLTDAGATENQLAIYFGWKDPRPAKNYIERSPKRLLHLKVD